MKLFILGIFLSRVSLWFEDLVIVLIGVCSECIGDFGDFMKFGVLMVLC